MNRARGIAAGYGSFRSGSRARERRFEAAGPRSARSPRSLACALGEAAEGLGGRRRDLRSHRGAGHRDGRRLRWGACDVRGKRRRWELCARNAATGDGATRDSATWGVAAGRFAASGAVLSARAPKLPAAAQAPAASQAPATQAPGFRRHPADRLWDRFACLRDRVAEWGADLGRAPVVCPPDGRGLHTVAHGPVAASLPTRAFTIGLRCGTFGSPNYMFDADRRAAFAARRDPVGPPRVRFRLAWCG